LQAENGVGYKTWAKVFKPQADGTDSKLSDRTHLLEYDALAAKTASATARYNELSTPISG
jgi:hypothetical protein